jgi:hypothetical protein
MASKFRLGVGLRLWNIFHFQMFLSARKNSALGPQPTSYLLRCQREVIMTGKPELEITPKNPSKLNYPIIGCSECKTSRPMEIQAISPGLFGSGSIHYHCRKCGAQKSFELK